MKAKKVYEAFERGGSSMEDITGASDHHEEHAQRELDVVNLEASKIFFDKVAGEVATYLEDNGFSTIGGKYRQKGEHISQMSAAKWDTDGIDTKTIVDYKVEYLFTLSNMGEGNKIINNDIILVSDDDDYFLSILYYFNIHVSGDEPPKSGVKKAEIPKVKRDVYAGRESVDVCVGFKDEEEFSEEKAKIVIDKIISAIELYFKENTITTSNDLYNVVKKAEEKSKRYWSDERNSDPVITRWIRDLHKEDPDNMSYLTPVNESKKNNYESKESI